MPSDDERDSKATKLKDRDGFFAWKRTMRLVAMDKGDVYGIFDEDGTKGTDAAIPVGAGGAATKRKWSEVSMQLIGTIGKKIDNSTLQDIWSREYERIQAQGAGPPDQRPFVVALSMAALEQECARATVIGAGIARSQFIISLQSFTEDEKKSGGGAVGSGFIPYVDRVKESERKLAAMGVVMTDDEKKQLFFTHFPGTHSETWRISMSNWQENDALTFDAILSKGVQKQQKLDLDHSTAASSQVKAFAAKDTEADDESGRGKWTKDAHFVRKGKGRGRGRGGGGGGRNGARGNGRGKVYKVADKFEGYCWKCGKQGHKADSCWSAQRGKGSKQKGKGKNGGKGGKGAKGRDNGGTEGGAPGFYVTGFVATATETRQHTHTTRGTSVLSTVIIACVAATLCTQYGLYWASYGQLPLSGGSSPLQPTFSAFLAVIALFTMRTRKQLRNAIGTTVGAIVDATLALGASIAALGALFDVYVVFYREPFSRSGKWRNGPNGDDDGDQSAHLVAGIMYVPWVVAFIGFWGLWSSTKAPNPNQNQNPNPAVWMVRGKGLPHCAGPNQILGTFGQVFGTVFALVSPLVRLVSQKVNNQYDDDDGRFTIRANSTIPLSLRQSAKVIFDTGASVHIANTESYMQR